MAAATSRTGTIVAAAVGIAIAAAVGYGLHFTAKKRAEERALTSVLTETTVQLRAALQTSAPGTPDQIEGNLRVARSWSNPELAEATEQYLIGAREIVRRRADSVRFGRKAAASRAALAAHMNRAGRRDASWLRTASDLKKQLERDHFDLEVSLKALAELLDMLPDANKRLAPHVQASLLLEDGVRREARSHFAEEAKRAAGELEKARMLPGR